jgi:hypothetical protein
MGEKKDEKRRSHDTGGRTFAIDRTGKDFPHGE